VNTYNTGVTGAFFGALLLPQIIADFKGCVSAAFLRPF
jgi:hypothetical protein